MPAMNRDHRRKLDQWTVNAGQIAQINSQLEQQIRDLNAIRDLSAPEDVLEHYTSTLAHLRDARRQLEAAGRGLWARIAEAR